MLVSFFFAWNSLWTNNAGLYPEFDDWNELNINRYRDRRTIMGIFSNPEY